MPIVHEENVLPNLIVLKLVREIASTRRACTQLPREMKLKLKTPSGCHTGKTV